MPRRSASRILVAYPSSVGRAAERQDSAFPRKAWERGLTIDK